MTDPHTGLDIDNEPTDETILPPPEPNREYEALRGAIQLRVIHHLAPTDCPADMLQPLAASIAEIVERMIIKFAEGQKEHGGDFRDLLNADLAMEQELIDAMFYGPILRRLKRNFLKIEIP